MHSIKNQTMQRKLAWHQQLKVLKTNVHGWLHMKGGLKPLSSGLKPFLTEENNYVQLMYTLEMIDPNDTTKYQKMFDFIHVDKRWFYLTSDRQHFILADYELPPHRTVCHKGNRILDFLPLFSFFKMLNQIVQCLFGQLLDH